jgi:predicted lipid carrier protein YhbT
MATVEECRSALVSVVEKLAGDPEAARKVDLDRPLVCHIRDLDHYFHGRLQAGKVTEFADGDDPQASIRFTVDSDDLVALVEGRLNLAAAWASGRVSIKAGFGDLLKLRKLI